MLLSWCWSTLFRDAEVDSLHEVINPYRITTERGSKTKTLLLPLLVGAIALVGGIVLPVIGKNKKG
ncbi:MAG: hypothetical protein IBX72_15630 [Nitrospirae bacterium]|nr:hypothetical protein [Nitrospirota bacterium]